VSEKRIVRFGSAEKRPGGSHFIAAITADGIRKEIASLSLPEVVGLHEKLQDAQKLTKELRGVKLAEVETGVPLSQDWCRRHEASVRIMGLQLLILQARRGELRRLEVKQAAKEHEESQCWAHHFKVVASQTLSAEVYRDIAEETDRRTNTKRPEGWTWKGRALVIDSDPPPTDLATAIETLRKIAAEGCHDPYDAQKHAASGKDYCQGTCGPCVARDTLERLSK